MNVIEPRPQSSLRQDDLDFENELDSYIEHASQKPAETKIPVKRADRDQMEKGQREALGSDKKERGPVEPAQSDNDDSELDDYNFTDDQRRALEELDNLKTELGYPDEDPPEYNVKERLKTLNKELYEDPTPVEKQKDSRVGFKQNLVDLVAPPPPDFSDDDDPTSPKSKETKTAQQKQSQDKTDDKSETISGKKSNSSKDKVLIERDGKFELVSSDDVHAHDLGMPRSSHDKENQQRKTSQRKPAPPQKPRPATANGTSRRNIRTVPAKPRPQSAQPAGSSGQPLTNFTYNSPYAMSPREKELLEERKKALERQRKGSEQRKKHDNESKERENRDAFEYWLKKKRENRRGKINEEDQRHKDENEDRSENEEAFKHWLKEKSTQFRKEKLLKQREDQELHDGYYVRSRDDCDKAYKQWLRHKTSEVRKVRVEERQKHRLHRLATRRTRRGQALGKAIRDNQAFRYVDYYGYRF